MEKRIVRLEDNFWRIKTENGAISETEQRELKIFFEKSHLQYCIVEDSLCVSGDVDRTTVFKKLEDFYEGRAEIYPF